MKFCQMCGTQVKNEDTVCPVCNAAITGKVVQEVVGNPNAILASHPEKFNSYGNDIDSSEAKPIYGNGVNAVPYANGSMQPNQAPYGNGGIQPNQAPYANVGMPNTYAQLKPEKKGSIALGIIGAIIGFIVVALLWVLVTRLGYIVYIQGALLVFVPSFMYTVFSKRSSIVSLVVICVIALLLVYPIALTSNLIDLKATYNEIVEDYYDGDEDLIESESIASLSEAYEQYPSFRAADDAYDTSQKEIYIISFISAAVGVIASIVQTVKGRK